MKKTLVLFATILFGLFLRIYQLEQLAGLDFDQEKAAFWVRDFLIYKKISLVGQEISTGGVFIGPFYYYLLSPFFSIFKMNPLAANILASLLAVVSMFMVYKIGERLFSKKVGLIALFLYAVSFRINFYDRTTAPSNLVMLLSSLIFFSLLKIRAGSTKWIVVIALCLGMGFSVHPTMVALFFIVAVVLSLFPSKINRKYLLLSALIIVLFLAPLILFDLRHEFFNSLGVLNVLSRGGLTFDGLLYKVGTNWQSLMVTLESLILPKHLGGLFILTIFFFVIRKKGKKNLESKWLLIWLIIPFILLCFYPLNVPEYYFLLTFPIFLVFFSKWIFILLGKRRIILCLLLTLVALFNLIELGSYKNTVGMKNKKDAIKFIIDSSSGSNFKVDYWTDLGQKNGFDYLFWYYGKVPVEDKNARRFVIVIPARKDIVKPNQTFGSIQVIRDDVF